MDAGFSLANLPYGVGRSSRFDGPRVLTRLGDEVVDLVGLADAGLLPDPGGWWRAGSLNPFLAAGPQTWAETRERLTAVLRDDADRPDVTAAIHPAANVELLRPIDIGDYVDFYASEHHAANVGRILRPGTDPLPPNWRHLPIGYHGRSGTVVVSGTSVRRPCGQRRAGDAVTVGPTERLDVEVEVGFVVGVPSTLGEPVPVEQFADHVFGVCLVNDWSARDIQAWEYQPLGPFLGKSFATSMSGWIVPLAALESARCAAGSADRPLQGYLREAGPWGLDLELELRINDAVVSRPPYSTMFWSPAQMLAHLTMNGASVQTGDLYASGTVSGPALEQVGSLIERWNNERFLDDGDEVVISGTALGTDGGRISLGEVRGTVVPAR